MTLSGLMLKMFQFRKDIIGSAYGRH